MFWIKPYLKLLRFIGVIRHLLIVSDKRFYYIYMLIYWQFIVSIYCMQTVIHLLVFIMQVYDIFFFSFMNLCDYIMQKKKEKIKLFWLLPIALLFVLAFLN